MFWSKVREEMSKYGEVREWETDFLSMPQHDNICGLKIRNGENEISVVSHKHSYGGNEDLFEIMPGVEEHHDVEGYLSEEEVIEAIRILRGR